MVDRQPMEIWLGFVKSAGQEDIYPAEDEVERAISGCSLSASLARMPEVRKDRRIEGFWPT